jgi:hypothetical protein
MATDFIGNCSKTVQADFEDVTATLNFASAAFRVSAKSGPILALVAANEEARTTVKELKAATIGELTLLYSSLYVQAWTIFEAFVRNLVVAYLEEFTARKSDYATLEKVGLTLRNLEHTGRALRYIREDPPRLSLDFFSLAKNASTSVPGSPKVTLNASAFPLFLANPSPQGLKDALDRIGMRFEWDDLARIDYVQKALRSKGSRETSKQIVQFLSETVRRRNGIVHRVSAQEPIGESDVVQVVDVLISISKGLLQLAKADYEKKCR